jgi:lipid-A-disaccharide synthase
MKKIVFVAGDKSGDLYAGLLSKKLKDLYKNDVEIYSFGGKVLANQSTQILDLVNFSVSGIFEVVAHFKKVSSAFRATLKKIKDLQPDLVILVDFPDFNLRLAKRLKRDFTIFYYISPQIWAWRKRRINLMKRYIDKMIVIFNFEYHLYKKNNMDVVYFGHPLLDIINERQSQPKSLILFLPGSRKNEVKNHLPIMIETKKLIEKDFPNYDFKVIKPENIEESFYKKIIGNQIDLAEHSYQLLSEAKFVITASGTATLEIAILEIPFIILYKVNYLSWLILKNIVKVRYIGMPNIVSGEKIVEEFIQDQATPKNLANLVGKLLKNREAYQRLKENLRKVKEKLKPQGAIENTAKFIGDHLGFN